MGVEGQGKTHIVRVISPMPDKLDQPLYSEQQRRHLYQGGHGVARDEHGREGRMTHSQEMDDREEDQR